MAEWLRRQPVNQEVTGSNLAAFQSFLFLHIENAYRNCKSLDFDSIQSIVSKFRCIDPTLDVTPYISFIPFLSILNMNCFLLFHKQNQEKEVLQKKWQIAQEFSDLVIYCRSTPYQPEG